MIDPRDPRAPRRASALRATAIGGSVALVLGALVAVAGLLPDGLAPTGLAGVGAAVLAALLAAVAHARIVGAAAVERPAAAGAQVTGALALGFLAKLLVLALGLGVLWACGVKFAAFAAFALAFAAASLLIQVVSALLLNRALARGAAIAQTLHRT